MERPRRETRQLVLSWIVAGALFGGALAALALFAVPRIWRSPESAAALARRPPRGGPDPLDMLSAGSSRAVLQAATGGTLAAPRGAASLDLPPGALAADTTVEIERLEVGAEDTLGAAVDLRPDGLELLRPARLEMPVPAGLEAAQVEIAVYDPGRRRWVAETATPADPGRVAAEIRHFSLRRVRIRPGMNYPFDPRRARAAIYLSSDAENAFERYVAGRWRAAQKRSAELSQLLRVGRLGRHDLIATGRLRAIARNGAVISEPLDDSAATATLPAGAPGLAAGCVRLVRPQPDGELEVLARVVGETPPELVRAGLAVRMSRAAAEALGLRWGEHFGLEEQDPERIWLRVPAAGGPAPYVDVRVEACASADVG